ncbi:DUF429 domain-containing protein [Kibdelosporangium aridum]|uniref:DUF429 domain-containing protein n=1 Tax=Kibdelosporangium aridum TaxID=2030 RepID=A0A428Z1U3_KIBAR|nr:DUF429 domain-containing protein [Kibdelosporangium aridum]RSM79023.1 DUF429 domain-containing protein [Kibdelosporangium aridum]
MRTVGVDLAVQPDNTAIAVVDWPADRARVVDIQIPADDDAVLKAAETADKVGIDCPLGWPDVFVRFLRSFHEGSHAAIPPVADADWRRSMANRVTDLRVRDDPHLNLRPLSVAADRIGLTAMRAARLQALLAEKGHDVDRTGTGRIVEVYPAAGLVHWNMNHRLYKGKDNQANLAKLVGELPGWLDLGDHKTLCETSDHAFDAVMAALIARAAVLRRVTMPSAGELAAAVREGWIAVPTCAIDDLVGKGGARTFKDDDEAYLAWQAAHLDLFVINAERSMNPKTMVLHRASCGKITGAPPWTGSYVKICGTRAELGEYPTARPCQICRA